MVGLPAECEKKCACEKARHVTRLVVLTGGPGAGKTAVLEMVKKVLCEHVVVLPESAGIIFGGGFWRLESPSAKIASQRAIYHVQREMENLVLNEKKWAMALCDRGTLDGLAYWPESEHSFWENTNSSLKNEYSHYHAVIHLRSPSDDLGYNHVNPLRIESATQALAIDQKICRIWSEHTNYHQIESRSSFLEKANSAIELISNETPECCRHGISDFVSNKNVVSHVP